MNPDCSGIHHVKDCLIALSGKCKEILNKYRDKRKYSLKVMSSEKSYDGRYEVILIDCYN